MRKTSIVLIACVMVLAGCTGPSEDPAEEGLEDTREEMDVPPGESKKDEFERYQDRYNKLSDRFEEMKNSYREAILEQKHSTGLNLSYEGFPEIKGDVQQLKQDIRISLQERNSSELLEKVRELEENIGNVSSPKYYRSMVDRLQEQDRHKISVRSLNFSKTSYPKCQGLASNSLEEERINIVFNPIGYENLSNVRPIVDAFVDYNGTGNGLFSVDPFKDKKDKFNFWLSTDIQYEENHREFVRTQQQCSDFAIRQFEKRAAEICPFSKTLYVNLVRYPSSSFAGPRADGNGSMWMRVQPNYEENLLEDQDLDRFSIRFKHNLSYLDNSILHVRRAPTFLHEIGHSFGLGHEIVEKHETMEDEPTVSKMCFKAESKEACRQNAPWSDFLGKGEGYGKVGCYNNCAPHLGNYYRSSKRSIMGTTEGMYWYPENQSDGVYSTDYDYVYNDEDALVYGEYNEHLIEQRMDGLLSGEEGFGVAGEGIRE